MSRSIVHASRAAGAILILSLLAAIGGAQDKAAEKITYDDHARPVLVQRCGSCHNGQKREGDLDVTNYINLMEGGGSGAVIEPQDASGSYLYSLITHEDSPEMPPSGTKIPDAEIKLLAQWIDMGALENKGSKAAKPKPKLSMALSANPTARPEVLPMPLQMPLEPVIQSAKPSVLEIATSPWAPVVAISAPKQILLYNAQTLELAGVLPMEEGQAHSLRFSRNGQYLLAGGGKDGALGKSVLFNVLSGERVTSIGEELDTVLAADLSPSQEYVAIGGPNKLVKLMYTDGTLVAEIKKHTDWITALEFSPDGKYLATGDRNGGLHIWDGETGDPLFTLKGHSAHITGISWRPDSLFVASCSEDSTIRLWELEEGKQIKSWGAHGGGTTAVEFRRDGNLVSCGRDKLVKLWDQNGKVLRQFGGLTDVAMAVSHCDETDRIFAADWTGQVIAWNAADGKQIATLAANPPSLAQRIKESEAALAQANQAHQPLATQVAQTQSAMTQMDQNLNASKQASAQLQTKLTGEEQQLASVKQQLTATQTKLAQLTAEHATKAKAKPMVVASLQKAKEAAATLPNDAELKATVATLTGKLQQIDQRLQELAGLMQTSSQEKDAQQATMQGLTQTVTAHKQEMATLVAEVKQMEGQLAKMKTDLAAQQAAAAAALQQVQAWTAKLSRWNANVQFISKMNTLKQQLGQAEQEVAQKQATVDSVHQELVAAQQKVESAKQAKAQADAKSKTIAEQIEALRRGN